MCNFTVSQAYGGGREAIPFILTKLHPNGSTDGKVMTSYRFFQRAAIELGIYPGFGFSDNTKIRSRDNFQPL